MYIIILSLYGMTSNTIFLKPTNIRYCIFIQFNNIGLLKKTLFLFFMNISIDLEKFNLHRSYNWYKNTIDLLNTQ